MNSLRLVALGCVVFLCACTAGARDTQEAALPSVSIMTFNVQNLFDNVDDPGKDDKAYLPIEAKQDPAHIAACNRIDSPISSRW